MNMYNIFIRFSKVFTKEEMGRITGCTNADVGNYIRVDVHGLTKPAAKRFINNIINIIRDAFGLLIVHGFRHGTVIKEMLRSEFWNPKVSDMYEAPSNPGVTYLVIMPAYLA